MVSGPFSDKPNL